MDKKHICALQTPGGIQWQVLQEYSHLLEKFDLDEVTSRAQIIKESPARKVCSIVLDDVECILKLFYTPTFFDRLRVRFFSSKAQIEWNYLQLLHSFQIPTPKPIAVGRKKTVTYLITRKIPNALSVKEIVSKPLTFLEKRNLQDSLAVLIASLHNHSIIHDDLHFGNVIQDEEKNIYILDLHSMHIAKKITACDCLENLAMFMSAFAMTATYTDFAYFFRKYYEISEFMQSLPWEMALKKASLHLQNYQLRFWSRRARRCLKSNKYFQKIRRSGGNGFCLRGDEEIQRIFSCLPEEMKKGKILKDSRSTTVVKADCGIIKQFHRKKRRNLVIDCFRHSRSRRAWLASYQCQIRGIKTAKAKGFWETYFGPFLLSHYLVTEELENIETMYEYLRSFSLPCTREKFEEKKKFMYQLGKFVRTLHIRGISHRDLKSNNILIRKQTIYLIDLDGFQIPRKLTEKRRIKDLRRVIRALKDIPEITQADTYRMIKAYMPFATKEELMAWIEKLEIKK